MGQWCEHSPPTNVAQDRLPELMPYVGGACCWFSSLLRGFSSGYSGFPPSTKTNISTFQFELETVDKKPLCGCATEIPIYSFITIIIIFFFFFDRLYCCYDLCSPMIRLDSLLRQWMVVRGESGEMEFNHRRISLIKQCKSLQGSHSKSLIFLIPQSLSW